MTRVGPQYGSNYREQDDAYVAKHPPKIVWRKRPNGVFVAVSVQETEPRRSADRQSATCCHAGHEYTEENTYVAPDGSVACRSCRNASARRRYHRQKTPDVDSFVAGVQERVRARHESESLTDAARRAI